MSDFRQTQVQKASQKQTYKLSQIQIQSINFLAMNNENLREEIFDFVEKNPFVEIVRHKSDKRVKEKYSESSSYSNQKADSYQQLLESYQNKRESLQEHLLHQLNAMKLSYDEYEICKALIYNLDKNGCYGNNLLPKSLLNPSRPLQNQVLLEKCIEKIQRMDPIGTCCKNLEESLFVQAKIAGDASDLTLFLLDGNLSMLNPPIPEKILKKINGFLDSWHKKAFAPALIIDDIEISEEDVRESLEYILKLNPKPAAEYFSDSSFADSNLADVALIIEKKQGFVAQDDEEKGIVKLNDENYLVVKYSRGDLPEIRLLPEVNLLKKGQSELVSQAKNFLFSLQYRESTILLQGIKLVQRQREFFEKGPGFIKPMTRKQMADELSLHESTISRITGKKNGKFLRCEWGVFPLSYFFNSGLKTSTENELSSETIKFKIQEIIAENREKNPAENLSDSKLTSILNEQGIKIARRTVAKYRAQLGIENSYNRQ